MKTKNIKWLTGAAVLTAALSVQAGMIESADSVTSKGEKSAASIWTRVQSVAKKKVAELMTFIETKTQKSDRQIASEAAPTPAPVATSPAAEPARVVTDEHREFAQVLEKAKAQIVEKDAIVVANPGRAASADLAQKKSGVPVFSLTAKETKKDKATGKNKTVSVPVYNIPRLDIGVERTIAKADFIPVDTMVSLKLKQKVQELASPSKVSQKEVTKLTSRPLAVIAKAKAPAQGSFQLGQLVSQKKIDEVSIEMKPTQPLADLKPYQEVERDHLNMIMAVILFQKKDKCHLASGLLFELADSKAFDEEANFYLGVCAHQMGFHSEAVNRLVRVVQSEHPDYTQEAVTNLVEDLPREHDARVAAALKGMKNQGFIAPEAKDNAHFVLARAAHAREAYGETIANAEKVSEKNAHYAEARYLFAIGLYADKKAKESEQTLLQLREWMTKKGKSDKNLEALIAVNLARMRFTQGRYQAAHEEYMRVPKDSPHWVQALIEQGWVQLSVNDPEGAIGNMYSLHSPYFKSVFMPESWVVRTIGYIDICQYGDAYRTLSRLEQLHGAWLGAVNKYRDTKKAPKDYYETVRNYIRGRSDANVDGLPHQIVREIARQRGFLNAQGAINVLEDEIGQYGFIYGLVKREQSDILVRMSKSKARIASLNANVEKAKKDAALKANLNEWMAQARNEEALVKYYQFQSSLYERARTGYLRMRTSALARIDQEKGRLRTGAGKELMSHLKDIHGRISQIVEGNEFLRYEIFAGSGENIRYQVAGGATAEAKRIPAHVKPQKILNWEFDGEYWEDEIGSYRSTLKNNCPKSRNAQADGSGGTGYKDAKSL